MRLSDAEQRIRGHWTKGRRPIMEWFGSYSGVCMLNSPRSKNPMLDSIGETLELGDASLPPARTRLLSVESRW